MKKILFIIPSLSEGGAERVVATLSRSLSSKYDVNIAVFSSKRIDYEYKGELIDLEIPKSQNRLIKDFKALRKIKKIKKNIEPDVSISFLPEPNLINVLSRTEKEKTIISVRNMFSRVIRRSKIPLLRFSKPIFKSIYKKADKVISTSDGVKEDLIKNFGMPKDKIKTIYNPCDIEEIKKKSKEKRILEREKEIFEKPTIINVGSLTEQKGQWHLIRSFKKVKEEIPEAQLVILGEGNLKEYLDELKRDMSLEDNVHLLGFKQNPFKYMKKSDSFVLSSVYEGLGNVIIESLACGTPVISTDCKSGPREILAPNTKIRKNIENIEKAEYGILVPPKNSEDLAEALLELIDNKEKRKKMGREGRKIIEKKFDIKDITEKYLNIYKEVGVKVD